MLGLWSSQRCYFFADDGNLPSFGTHNKNISGEYYGIQKVADSLLCDSLYSRL